MNAYFGNGFGYFFWNIPGNDFNSLSRNRFAVSVSVHFIRNKFEKIICKNLSLKNNPDAKTEDDLERLTHHYICPGIE